MAPRNSVKLQYDMFITVQIIIGNNNNKEMTQIYSSVLFQKS